MKIIEIACSNIESCIHAEQGGASRIELFENLENGGCTPSYGTIRYVVDHIAIPTYVMIRPRGGDFFYTEEEFDIMKSDVKICKELGVQGIVFGILKSNHEIDIDRCAELMEIWGSSKATFHRAIDIHPDMERAAEQIIDLGLERILTSGGRQTAIEGKDRILELHRLYSEKITIMAGSGIHADNCIEFSVLNEIHATCKHLKSRSEFFGDYVVSDREKIAELVGRFKN